MPINEQIKANKVQVIDEQGEKRGVMGIHDALDLAYEKKLDLVLVAPNAEIPVCKIMNYGKYKFEQSKKEKEAKKNQKVDYVFLLNVDKDTLLYRITGRRLCKSCGAIYNVNIDPLKPKIDSICDKCGSSLIARKDDNAETFKVRYQEYETQTMPLINYYQNQNNLFEIDSSISKEDTFKQIESILGNK